MPTPAITMESLLDHKPEGTQYSPDQLNELVKCTRRYLLLRNLREEDVGVQGMPMILLPSDNGTANAVTGDDADSILDAILKVRVEGSNHLEQDN